MSTAKTREGIVLLGCPRSGTTLLRRLLDAHPAIAAPGETYLLTAAARFLKGEPMVDNLEVGVLNGLGFLGVEPNEIVKKLRNFVFGFRRDHAAREGKRRWLEKTAVDVFHLPEITRLCDAQVHYVCMVRHGLDVVCSMQDWIAKSQAYPSELHQYIRDVPRPLEAFARAWTDATGAVTELVEQNPETATLIRYEDLVSDPEQTLSKLLSFLGEDPDPAGLTDTLANGQAKGFSDWKGFTRTTVDGTSIDRWKTGLSRNAACQLGKIVNPMLARHGYNTLPALAPRDDAEKRRRYEMGLRLQQMK